MRADWTRRSPILVVCAAVMAWAAAPARSADTPSTDRTITIVSHCPDTVRVGINGGRVGDCGASNACPAGTACYVDASGKAVGCYWDFPAPTTGTDVLKKGGRVVYTLDNPPHLGCAKDPGGQCKKDANGKPIMQHIKWSGNLYASSHCDAQGKNCKTAMCPQSVDGVASVVPCATGQGPLGPATLAEFTLQVEAVDFYDISVINGVNVPVSMEPVGGIAEANDPYSCQGAGVKAKSSTGLPGCSWTFDPKVDGSDRSTLLRAVAPGGAACTKDADCTKTGEVCGRQVKLGTVDVSQVCGAQIGWWTADELCVYTGNQFGAPIDCTKQVPKQGTRVNLYGCDGFNANSCYNKDEANSTCCGCPDWKIGGSTLPLAPGFQCYDKNKEWAALAEPWAAFVKKGCPTAYSFPFDDATSTFTCSTKAPSLEAPNTTGYTITFCPGGKTGV